MTSVTRILCKKYTDLTDAEISYVEDYGKALQALSNAEKADVFIDCRSATGKTAIVVCEAKPQTVPSAYVRPILGMLIGWQDEPAVDRTFRLGIPTMGVKTVQVPEGQCVAQTVEPIFFEEKLIAVLIYEKCEPMPGDWLWQGGTRDVTLSGADWMAVAQCLDDAIVFLNDKDMVCGYNEAASKLYRALGYVRDIMGMAAVNIQLGIPDASLHAACEVSHVNHQLRYRQLRLSDGVARTALIIRDMTEQRSLERALSLQSVTQRELRHRMKNNLYMISSLLRLRSHSVTDAAEAQTVLLDAANRLISMTATLDDAVQTTSDKVNLRHVLQQLLTYTLQTLLGTTHKISIRIDGDEIDISAEIATSVSMVVGELLQNALKYAFPSGAAGNLSITIQRGTPFCRITVQDDGVGFRPELAREGGIGMELVRAIVTEKLTGEITFASGSGGTCVSFDFLTC